MARFVVLVEDREQIDIEYVFIALITVVRLAWCDNTTNGAEQFLPTFRNAEYKLMVGSLN